MADREKYLARQRRYNASAKGQARYARYEETRIQVRFAGGTISTRYRVPAEKKHQLKERVADFRAQQREEYRDTSRRGFG
jgi:hypothetical protein